MTDRPINSLMSDTMQKIKEMVDVNTIIGNAIVAADGTTLIPISKVSFGFGSGGSDFKFKGSTEATPNSFGGGAGAGVTIVPVSFIVIANGDVRVLPINAPASTTSDRLVEMIPDVLSKISQYFEEKNGAKSDERDSEEGK